MRNEAALAQRHEKAGDQPARHEEKRAIESLAAAAHREAGFELHTLGWPREAPEVPCFADLSRAGGGRHASFGEDGVGEEVLACLLAVESAEEKRRWAELLRDVVKL